MEEDEQPKEAAPPLGTILRDLGRHILRHADAFQKAFQEAAKVVAPLLVNLQANLEALPGRITATQQTLARRGWFLPPRVPGMAFIKLVEEYSAAEHYEELDALLTEYIDSHLDEIEADLVANYPSRAAIFTEAFNAHRLKMYASSITVLLSQADGVCFDLLGEKLFRMKMVKGGMKQPLTRSVIESYGVSEFQEMMLVPLMSGSGMGAGEKEQDSFPDSLNRHTVMHGIDTSYPSRINSAKVISLLAYFGGIVHGIVEELKSEAAARLPAK